MFPRCSSQHRTGFRNNVPTPLKRCSRSSKHRLPPAMSRVHPFHTAALPPEVHEWRRQIVVIGRLISGENPVLLPCRFSGGQSNDAFISRTLYPDCTPCTRATMLPRNEAELELLSLAETEQTASQTPSIGLLNLPSNRCWNWLRRMSPVS